MIYDSLKNITLYTAIIPKEVFNFICAISPEMSEGKYNICDSAYANVESYLTKLPDAGKFESHEKYIDIQILLKGCENIYYTAKSGLIVSNPYNSEKDIAFYADSIAEYNKITLDGSNFVILYPHEAHAPQVCVNNIQSGVKKLVIKIRV